MFHCLVGPQGQDERDEQQQLTFWQRVGAGEKFSESWLHFV